MSRAAAPIAARELVAARFPAAVQAWLAGSVSRGEGTTTSELDITVLLDGRDIADAGGVHRETLDHDGWPVELFVHTEASIDHYVAQDRRRRHPTMARLVATGLPLLAGSGGELVRARCERSLEQGPEPVGPQELMLLRYGLTDLLDDLTGRAGPELTATAVGIWRSTAELALAVAGAWTGTGKWLVRELRSLDGRLGSTLTDDLDGALSRALAGDTGALVAAADGVLDRCGGRYRAGLHVAGENGSAP